MEPLNLLELKPQRKVKWDAADENSVMLLVPKFKNAFLRKWLVPWLKQPDFRVRLDEFGSFVWLHCDGSTDVGAIADSLSRKFGPAVEPLYERLEKYLKKLEREDFITVI